MREIDFLPQWYKHGRVERRKHYQFYIAIGAILLVMVGWCVFANSKLAAIKYKNAKLQQAKQIQINSESEYNKVQREFSGLEAKQQVLEKVKSRIAVSNVIAEMSCFLNGKVSLHKLEIKSEPIDDSSNGLVDLNAAKQSDNVRFKIIITGIAVDAAAVAEVITSLEQSDYFFQVIPGYSRNAVVAKHPVCEFELTCYLSNYEIKNNSI